jgi:hypothetical protein
MKAFNQFVALVFLTFLMLGGISAQSTSCDAYYFEVEAIQPSSAASQGRFNINLVTLDPNGFPSTIELDQLTFSGKIGLTISSNIDIQQTNSFNASILPYGQFVNIDAVTGDVSWEVSNTNVNCLTNDDPPITMSLPITARKALLFTVVVNAMPNEQIRWTGFDGAFFICGSGCQNLGIVTPTPNAAVLNFPAITTCSFSPPACFEFGYDPAFGLFLTPNNFPSNINYRKVELKLLITPIMSGSVSIVAIPAGPPIVGITIKQNQLPNGKIEMHLVYDQPGTLVSVLSFFEIVGQPNLSFGGAINFEILSSRITTFSSTGLPQVCSVNCTSQNIIIPGFLQCDPDMVITSDVVNQSGCDREIEFTLKSASQPNEIQDMTLRFAFSTMLVNPSPSFTAPIYTDLPCSGCWSSAQVGSNWEVTYEYKANQHGGNFYLSDPARIIWPLTINTGCMQYAVVRAEAVLAGQSDPCAIASDIRTSNNPEWPVCSELVEGLVVRGSLGFSTTGTGANLVTLVDALNTVSTEYLPLVNCSNNNYSICAPDLRLPATLDVTDLSTDYLCGVNLLDVLKVQRHLLGLQPLDFWGQVASDVNKSSNITTSDIVEMRKLILGAYYSFPNVRSWEYFTEEQLNTGAVNPFNQFPNSQSAIDIWNFQTLLIDNPDLQLPPFLGAKMGDVSGDCKACSNKNAVLPIHDLQVAKQNGGVELFANGTIGLQAELEIKQASNVQIEINMELGMDENSYRYDPITGLLKILWLARDAETPITEQDWLIRITSKSEALEVNLKESSEQLAITTTQELAQLQITSFAHKKHCALQFQVSPQPISSSAIFTFDHPDSGELLLEFGHMSGLRQKTFKFNHLGGKAQHALDFNQAIPGSYLLKVRFNNEVGQSKLIKL